MPDDSQSPDQPPVSLSRFLASMIGPVFLALTAAMMVNPRLVPEVAREIEHDEALIMVSGILLLIAGIAIVRNHATWRGWPALVTLMGWILILSGLIRTVLPFHLAKLAASIGTSPAVPLVSGIVCAALGGFLTYKAYFETDPTQ